MLVMLTFLCTIHSSPTFILLTCSIPVINKHFQSVENNVDPDQNGGSLDLQWFKKMDESWFSKTKDLIQIMFCQFGLSKSSVSFMRQLVESPPPPPPQKKKKKKLYELCHVIANNVAFWQV